MTRHAPLFLLLLAMLAACTDPAPKEPTTDKDSLNFDGRPVRPPHWSDSGRWQGPPVSSDSLIWEYAPMELEPGFFQRKNLSFAGDWHPDSALKTLIPGKLIRVSPLMNGDSVSVMAWHCPECQQDSLPGWYEKYPEIFPFRDGTDTRVLKTHPYFDADSTEKVLFFLTSSWYSEDFLLSGRWQCGVLGVAIFARTEENWEVEMFDPAVGCFGSASQAPEPTIKILSADKTPGFYLINQNGPIEGPVYGDFHLFEKKDSTYEEVLKIKKIVRVETERAWNYEMNHIVGFEQVGDIEIIRNGAIDRSNLKKWEHFPPAIDTLTGEKFRFAWRQIFQYEDGKFTLKEEEISRFDQ